MTNRNVAIALILGFAYLACATAANAVPAAERVVIIKADGLPFGILDSFVQQRDPYTGKSVLPWIEHVFYRNGSRLANFYTRGLSLSAQSWAMLDTGQHSIIKGNLEFDRLTLESYDYLDMFSFVVRNSGRNTPTPGMQILDEQEIPVLFDAYEPNEVSLGTQIYIRSLPIWGMKGLKRLLTLQNPKEWLDEWIIGLEGERLLAEISERQLLTKLKDPAVHYLDVSIPVFDHMAHRNRELEAQLNALQQIDTVVKDIWTAIEESPLASRTLMILVSDHGINTDPEVYSQGYSLIDLFGGAAGGGHHIVTNRPPLSEYSLKSLSPAVPEVTTVSRDSYYLKGQAAEYPTLALDADGNERSSVYLRHSDLNVLQILWEQLRRKDIAPDLRRAATAAFFEVINRNRPTWEKLRSELEQELPALRRSARSMAASLKSKTQEERKRLSIKIESMNLDEQKYGTYLQSLVNLLALDPEHFDVAQYSIEELVPKKSFGQLNSVHDLQNYVVGIGKNGLVLNEDGSLDAVNSFVRINYFTFVKDVRVQNNVQREVSSKPVDFIATSISGAAITAALSADVPIERAVWVYQDVGSQALILIRHDSQNRPQLRCMPVRNLRQDSDGEVHFIPGAWAEGLPLATWESLPLPLDQREAWLDEWHSDVEWLEMLHAGKYSNAIVGLAEQFTFDHVFVNQEPDNTDDQGLIVRFRQRKREVAQADFIIFAKDHWNFNFRAFNPGGNHGSFLRESTHATLMFAGGTETGIPRGLRIDRPYDNLSLMPTVLTLAGRIQSDVFNRKSRPTGTAAFPGPIIRELFPLPAGTVQ